MRYTSRIKSSRPWLRMMGASGLLLLWMVSTALAEDTPPSKPAWGGLPYSTQVDQVGVHALLKDFCKAFGLRLQWSANQSAVVSGRVGAATSSEFLDNISSAYGLNWFYHAGSLYVSGSEDWTTKSLPVSPDLEPNLRQILKDLRIFNEKFGWADSGDQGFVVVSGPLRYVALVESTLEALKPAAAVGGEQVTVFRLHYASVQDRIVKIRDQELVIPGVESVLQKLLQGGTSAIGSVASERGQDGTASNGGDAMRSSLVTFLPAVAATPQRPVRGARRNMGPGIVADARLNALMIRDDARRLPLYEKLIAELDVPTDLVQIEVSIIDISSLKLSALGVHWSTVASTAGMSSLSVVNDMANLISSIQALENSGDARVMSKPVIVTSDNTLALIDLSQTFYVPLTGDNVANLVPVTAGVMLKVSPHVVAEAGKPRRAIQLALDIEDGGLVNRDGLSYPVVQKSTLSTQTLVGENQSLLIGGYNAETNYKNQMGVPFLKDIPFVGSLFKSDFGSSERRERLFLITPKIVPLASIN